MDLSKTSCTTSLVDGFRRIQLSAYHMQRYLFISKQGKEYVCFFHSKIHFLLFNKNVNQNLIRLILDIVDSDNDAAGAVIAADSVRII